MSLDSWFTPAEISPLSLTYSERNQSLNSDKAILCPISNQNSFLCAIGTGLNEIIVSTDSVESGQTLLTVKLQCAFVFIYLQYCSQCQFITQILLGTKCKGGLLRARQCKGREERCAKVKVFLIN